MATNTTQNSSIDNQLNQHHIVWLDKQINYSYNRGRLRQIRELDSQLKSFTCDDECLNYIQQFETLNTNSYIIFIISGSLSERILPKIHDSSCIVTIFIFCTNVDDCKHLEYQKLRAICNDTYELIDQIELYLTRSNERELQFSLFHKPELSTSENQYPIRNLKEDQARFLWFYHCHNHMLKLDSNDDREAKEELIIHARQDLPEKQYQSSIEEFNNESIEKNRRDALLWYTRNAFIYKCVNTVLRKENLSQIYHYRYIIKLLCYQLKDYSQTFQRNTSLRLFRGQQFRIEYITLLENHQNDLISFNGFMSTTLEEDIAMKFAFRYRKDNLKSVVFIVDVNLDNESNVIFADIRNISKYPEEEEILFSIGTIFRMKSIELNQNKQLYIIHLELVDHNELQAIKYIEQSYNNDGNFIDQKVLFGKLLFDMGEHEFARKYFLDALDHLTENENHLYATYVNNIGVCYNEQGDRKKALEYYKKACEIYLKMKNYRGLGTCQHNIASIYYAERNYRDALNEVLHALHNRSKKTLEKASTHDLLGCIYLTENNMDAAEHNFSDALKIRRRCLNDGNPNHPDIGISYQNLGELCRRKSKFQDAYKYYSRAAEIFRHNYPQSHRLNKDIDRCLNELQL
ncbi:hypothetical protein I4U23_000953 [Adineta vaga]|nr:hypothetical protein I4U23_000953 [Adineta vaga]